MLIRTVVRFALWLLSEFLRTKRVSRALPLIDRPDLMLPDGRRSVASSGLAEAHESTVHQNDRTTVTIASTPIVARDLPPPHVPCKIYYPKVSDLSPGQKAFYDYWRHEVSRGNMLPADATYRYLYAYERATHATSVAALDRAWSRLREAYAVDKGFSAHMARWLVDLRMSANRFVADDAITSLTDSALRVDYLLLGNERPRWLDVAQTYMADPTAATQVAASLSDGAGDLDSLIALARTVEPVRVHAEFFQGLLSRASLSRLVTLRDFRMSFVQTPDFATHVRALLESTAEMLGISMRWQSFPTTRIVGDVVGRVPIDRGSAPVPPLVIKEQPAPDSLAGLLSTIRFSLGDDARLLLAIVLSCSETLPYIEGRVDFERGLRANFVSCSTALGRTATLGHFRGAFFQLGHGPRAAWQLDPPAAAVAEIRMQETKARFVRGLQHALIGTDARRLALRVLIEALAKRLQMPDKKLVEALAAVAGAGSVLLPSRLEPDGD